MTGWIGVDLDGTLAMYDGHFEPDLIGAPVPLMVARVKKWLDEGKFVRIVTARAALKDTDEYAYHRFVEALDEWCVTHIGRVLPITCSKDCGMLELWDDRAVQVIPNTGVTLREQMAHQTAEVLKEFRIALNSGIEKLGTYQDG